MKLEVKSTQGAGDLNQERVVLQATENLDIGLHMVLGARRGKTSRGVLGGSIPHSFWLPDKKISKGDFVVLYTKNGANSEKKNEEGNITHFFYWELTAPIWHDEVVAVVAEIQQWLALPLAEDKISAEALPERGATTPAPKA
jgi:hypothetical protein